MVLGAMRLDGVSALVTALVRQATRRSRMGEGRRKRQVSFSTFFFCCVCFLFF